MRVNLDSVAAILLLVMCGVFWVATYSIADMGFSTLAATVWPRIILVALAVMSMILLVTSIRRGVVDDGEPHAAAGVSNWLRHYQNPIICFVLYLLFLISMPYLGMLLGGIAFVFATMTLIGARTPRALALHLAIAVVTIGAMWSIFTFGLRVILPAGEILPPL